MKLIIALILALLCCVPGHGAMFQPSPAPVPEDTTISTGFMEEIIDGVVVRFDVNITVTKPPVAIAPPPAEVPLPPEALRPNAPTEATAELITHTNGSTSASLRWKDASLDEWAFIIWRKATGGEWQVIGAVPQGSVTFIDWGARGAGSRYQYRIQALGENGASPATPEMEVAIP